MFFFLMIRRPPRSTQSRSSAASDVYKRQEFDKFKKLENEIVHFKRIKFSDGEKFEQIKKKIEEIKQYPEKQKELDKQYGKMPREEFARKQMSLFEAQNFEYKGKKLKIKYIQKH